MGSTKIEAEMMAQVHMGLLWLIREMYPAISPGRINPAETSRKED